MHHLAHSVAQLTAHRNRGALDRAALDLVNRYATGASISLYKCVGLSADPRLLQTAQVVGNSALTISTSQVLLDMLPSVSTVPLFEHALRVRAPVYHSASGHHVFPVTSDSGCVALIDLQPQVPLDAKQVSIIQSLVGVYRNQVTLLDYSETDSLTGLLNRKTYDVRFYESAQAHAAAEQVSPLAPERRAAAQHSWIGVIDLDHFKRVNDTHGHLIGDELLLMVAQLMRASFRYGDELFRFGGEEFVVLLRAPDAAHARRAFERFRANLAQQVFPRVGHVSASLGFTQVGEADSPSDAFGRADRAVYFAKQNGRNQVCCFEELLAGGALSAPVHVGEVELF